MVSPARMSTSRSSMVNVVGVSAESEVIVVHFRLSSPRTRGPIVPHTPATGIWVPAFAGTTSEHVAAFSFEYAVAFSLPSSQSPAPERLAQLLGKVFQHAQQRVGRRLAEAADRGVAHGVRELCQQRLIPGA